jgi:menaquinone-dependent protoporphyrinogen oxidase
VFAGVVERHRWSMTGGLILRLFGGHFGDNRDWNDIDQWADQIARAANREAARRKAIAAPVKAPTACRAG